jgi:hypothetical protein
VVVSRGGGGAGDSSQLERVLQEVRPQDVGEEAVALAEYGAKLKPLLAWAEHLREGKRVQTDFHSANGAPPSTPLQHDSHLSTCPAHANGGSWPHLPPLCLLLQPR